MVGNLEYRSKNDKKGEEMFSAQNTEFIMTNKY